MFEKWKQKLAIIFSTILMVSTLALMPVQAATTSPDIAAKAGIAVDAQTGQVLYTKNSNQVLPIASMSKLLSIYLILKSIHEGKLRWNQQVPISKTLAKISKNKELTNVALSADRTYTVRELYKASLIYSANAAVMALGIAQAGSSKAFVDEMRTQVKTWGIKDAKLYNAAGLTESLVGTEAYPNTDKNAENEMSAKDMAVVASKLIQDYPEVLETTKQTNSWFAKGTVDAVKMTTHNNLLPKMSQAMQGYQVDGLKTGTSDEAKACFTGTVNKNGHRVITVVMGASEKKDGKARFTTTKTIMKYVYTQFKPVRYKKRSRLQGVAKFKVPDGKTTSVRAVNKQAITVWLPNNQNQQSIRFMAQKQAQKAKVAAPVKKDQILGTAIALVGDTQPEYLQPGDGKIQLVAQEKIEKANVFVRFWRATVNFLRGLA